MNQFKTLDEIDVNGKVVLLRADLNVPSDNHTVTDTTRIDRLKNTIEHLNEQGAKTLIVSHFGRPKGRKDLELSLEFLTPVLQQQWGFPVHFIPECIGEVVENSISAMLPGSFALLENVRFHAEEEMNDHAFAEKLAEHADVYINDAFSTAHRAHASTEAVAHILPSAAGFLMESELNALNAALDKPQRPAVAVVGGAKISTKLNVLNNIVKKVDFLVLGGGMANTFMFAEGTDVGSSICEKNMVFEAQTIMKTAEENNCKIVLPIDITVVSGELNEHAFSEIINRGEFRPEHSSVDAGPESISNIKSILTQCKTVLWNGPLGVFEIPPFDKGTNEIAKEVAELTGFEHLISIAGGGDTVAALENAGVVGEFSYISTAGGAFLEWLEGRILPGVAALSPNSSVSFTVSQ